MALAGPMPGWAQGILFSVKPSLLSLSECVAEPGAVPIPGVATNLNLEVAGWQTQPVSESGPGTFHLVFKEPTRVGTVLVHHAGSVSYQVGKAWKTLDPGAETGRDLQVLTLPEGVDIQAVRITVPSRPDGADADGAPLHRAELSYATLIPVRLARLTEPVEVTAHCANDKAGEVLLDGRVDPERNWTSDRHALTPETPEWVMLKWNTPQTVRGVMTFRGREDGGLGSFFTEVFTGEGDPVGGGMEGWQRPVGRRTPTGPFRSSQFFVALQPVTGRALRLISAEGGARAGLGEVILTRDAGTPSKAGPVTPGKVN